MLISSSSLDCSGVIYWEQCFVSAAVVSQKLLMQSSVTVLCFSCDDIGRQQTVIVLGLLNHNYISNIIFEQSFVIKTNYFFLNIYFFSHDSTNIIFRLAMLFKFLQLLLVLRFPFFSEQSQSLVMQQQTTFQSKVNRSIFEFSQLYVQQEELVQLVLTLRGFCWLEVV